MITLRGAPIVNENLTEVKSENPSTCKNCFEASAAVHSENQAESSSSVLNVQTKTKKRTKKSKVEKSASIFSGKVLFLLVFLFPGSEFTFKNYKLISVATIFNYKRLFI